MWCHSYRISLTNRCFWTFGLIQLLYCRLDNEINSQETAENQHRIEQIISKKKIEKTGYNYLKTIPNWNPKIPFWTTILMPSKRPFGDLLMPMNLAIFNQIHKTNVASIFSRCFEMNDQCEVFRQTINLKLFRVCGAERKKKHWPKIENNTGENEKKGDFMSEKKNTIFFGKLQYIESRKTC